MFLVSKMSDLATLNTYVYKGVKELKFQLDWSLKRCCSRTPIKCYAAHFNYNLDGKNIFLEQNQLNLRSAESVQYFVDFRTKKRTSSPPHPTSHKKINK